MMNYNSFYTPKLLIEDGATLVTPETHGVKFLLLNYKDEA